MTVSFFLEWECRTVGSGWNIVTWVTDWLRFNGHVILIAIPILLLTQFKNVLCLMGLQSGWNKNEKQQQLTTSLAQFQYTTTESFGKLNRGLLLRLLFRMIAFNFKMHCLLFIFFLEKVASLHKNHKIIALSSIFLNIWLMIYIDQTKLKICIFVPIKGCDRRSAEVWGPTLEGTKMILVGFPSYLSGNVFI